MIISKDESERLELASKELAEKLGVPAKRARAILEERLRERAIDAAAAGVSRCELSTEKMVSILREAKKIDALFTMAASGSLLTEEDKKKMANEMALAVCGLTPGQFAEAEEAAARNLDEQAKEKI